MSRTALALAFLLLLFPILAPLSRAQEVEDPYTATVKVDATAETAAKAREAARLDGQRRALGVIADHVSSGGAAKLAKFDDKTIADLIAYRRRYDHFVERSVETPFQSHNGGDWTMRVYINTLEYAEHIALIKGDISGPEPVLVRMHAINVFSDVLDWAQYEHDVLGAAMRRRSVVVRVDLVDRNLGRVLAVPVEDVSQRTRLGGLDGSSLLLHRLFGLGFFAGNNVEPGENRVHLAS